MQHHLSALPTLEFDDETAMPMASMSILTTAKMKSEHEHEEFKDINDLDDELWELGQDEEPFLRF